MSSPSRVERRCNHTSISIRPQKSGHISCAKGGRELYGGSIKDYVHETVEMEEVNSIHQYVQVHVDIREIYSIRVSEMNDPYGKQRPPSK